MLFLAYKHRLPVYGKQGLQGEACQSVRVGRTFTSGIARIDCSQNTVLCAVFCKKLPTLNLNFRLSGMWLYLLQGWGLLFLFLHLAGCAPFVLFILPVRQMQQRLRSRGIFAHISKALGTAFLPVSVNRALECE